MPGRTRSRPTRRGTRRSTAWFNNSNTPLTIAAFASGVFDLLPLAGIPEGFAGGLTVLRMIGHLDVRSDQTNELVYSAGIALMTRDAFAAGATPDPVTDLVDWYWLDSRFIRSSVLETVNTPFDIRTARKVRGEDRTLAFIIQNNGPGTANLAFMIHVRLLLARS